MPARLVKSFAKRTGQPVKEVERKWEKAKNLAAQEGFKEGDESFYAYTVGILKKMLGIKENYEFLEKFKKFLS